MSAPVSDRTKLSATIARTTGQRFCTSCQRTGAESEGRWHVTANGRRRFVCGGCAERLNKMNGRVA